MNTEEEEKTDNNNALKTNEIVVTLDTEQATDGHNEGGMVLNTDMTEASTPR